MNLDLRTLLIPSIVIIIGAVIGASVASVFADDQFKSKASSPDLKEDTKNNDCNNISCPTENSHHVDVLKVFDMK